MFLAQAIEYILKEKKIFETNIMAGKTPLPPKLLKVLDLTFYLDYITFKKSYLVSKKKNLFLRKGADQERSSRNGGRTIYVTSRGSKNKASRTDEFFAAILVLITKTSL